MITPDSFQIIDTAVFIIANLINVLSMGFLYSRAKESEPLKTILRFFCLIMIFPLSIAVILNLVAKREWWTYILPIPIILFFILELIKGWVLKKDFENQPLIGIIIAIVLYASGISFMLLYSYQLGKLYGFITLTTFSINTLATFYTTYKKKRLRSKKGGSMRR